MDITRWSILKSDSLYSLQPKIETLYKVKKQKQKQKPVLGAGCGSNQELLNASFRLILKKGGKTTRPFKYHLNQIPYEYTVEVTHRFKGLALIDRVPEELWMEVHDIVQEAVIKTIPKKMPKSKIVV